MLGEFAKCAFKVTEINIFETRDMLVSEDFRSQQPERGLDEPCGLTRRHTLFVRPSKSRQQIAERILKQSRDLFTETSLDERQVIEIQKL